MFNMKKVILFLLAAGLLATGRAQLVAKVKCGTFVVDILGGKVNGLKADAMPYDIKKTLPCFTSEEPEDGNSKCGGGVFYKDRDIYFYTKRDYVEIGPRFKGKLSIPLMGAQHNSLFGILGNPKVKDEGWDAYQTQYGTLVLHYNKAGRIILIQFSTRPTETLSLCE
jgi:hypothetical protein